MVIACLGLFMSSLCFFVNIVSGLSVLLIFSKKQLFVLLIFTLFFLWFHLSLLLSSLFPSFCLFWVYFALFCLGSWGESLDYWFETFHLLIYAFNTINFHLKTALALDIVHFHFSSVRYSFWFLLKLPLLPTTYLEVYLISPPFLKAIFAGYGMLG